MNWPKKRQDDHLSGLVPVPFGWCFRLANFYRIYTDRVSNEFSESCSPSFTFGTSELRFSILGSENFHLDSPFETIHLRITDRIGIDLLKD